jgi:hypothetical protein
MKIQEIQMQDPDAQLVSAPTRKRVIALFVRTNTMPLKDDLLEAWGGEGCKRIEELMESQAVGLAVALERLDEGMNKKRRKMISMCHQIGWLAVPGKVDYKRLDDWLKSHGVVKKPLRRLTDEELTVTITQFGELFKREIKAAGDKRRSR